MALCKERMVGMSQLIKEATPTRREPASIIIEYNYSCSQQIVIVSCVHDEVIARLQKRCWNVSDVSRRYRFASYVRRYIIHCITLRILHVLNIACVVQSTRFGKEVRTRSVRTSREWRTYTVRSTLIGTQCTIQPGGERTLRTSIVCQL